MHKGPCQPQDHEFPKRPFEVKVSRQFNPFCLKVLVGVQYRNCLYRYLFKTSNKNQGGNSFVGEECTYWKDKKCLILMFEFMIVQ